MGTTTEKMIQGSKEAAGTGQQAAEQGQDAVRAVDRGTDTAARGAEKGQKHTDRAAAKVKDA